jgi:hypothetical protein
MKNKTIDLLYYILTKNMFYLANVNFPPTEVRPAMLIFEKPNYYLLCKVVV